MDDLAAALELARRDPRRQVGRFLVLSELGRGGMGVVYRAWDPTAERAVALKVLLENDPEASARFRREGDAVARLHHPGIVRVHEQGVLGARPFVVMELVEGRSLEKAPAPLPVVEAVALTRALCDALMHAHERGVVHRDLKPSNVIVGPDGQPRILDFGLAKLADRSRLTKTGTLLGTASYMAPEQLDGRADARSDVYSLGATLYWLLTAEPPFAGSSVQNILVALARKDAAPPSRLNPAVTPELDGVLLRCLEKDPDARYPTAAAFSKALARALQGERVEAPRRRRLLLGTLAGAVLLSALAGGWWAVGDARVAPAAPVDGFDPSAAFAASTSALARGEPDDALAALATVRAATTIPEVLQRAAALEGEARWLLGDLALVETAAARADPRSATLLRALLSATRGRQGSTGADSLRLPTSSSGELGARPAGAFGKALLAGSAGDTKRVTRELEATGKAKALPLFLGLLRAGAARTAWWLMPKISLAEAAEVDDGATLAIGARDLLDEQPDDARALAVAACAAGLAPEARAALKAAALAATERGVGAETNLDDPSERLPTYRRAIARFRVALVIDPSTRPPGTLLLYVQQVPEPAFNDVSRAEREEARAIKRSHFGGDAADPARVEAALMALHELRARSTTGRRGRREVAFVAVEVLCHVGRNDEARAWIEKECEPITSLGLDDHDVLVQWARTLLAPAPRRRDWLEAALPILDRVIEEDPLHGDAREFRARIRLDLHDLGAEVDLGTALADLDLAEYDVGRAATTIMAERRTVKSVHFFKGEVVRRMRER